MTYGNKALSEEQGENEYTLYINNYRSLRTGDEDEYIQIRLGKITVLMGQRGSGKSSIIEAIHLLNTAYIYSKNEKTPSEMFTAMDNAFNPKLKEETEPIYVVLGNYNVNVSKKLNLSPKKTTLYDLINRMENEARLLLRKNNKFFGLILSIDNEKFESNIKEIFKNTKYEEIIIQMSHIDDPNFRIEELDENFITYISTVNRLNPFKESSELKESIKWIFDKIILEGIEPHGYKLELVLKILDSRYGTPYESVLSEIHNKFIETYNDILEKEGAPYRLEDIVFNDIENEVMFHYTNGKNKLSIPLSQLSKGTINLISIIIQIVLADIFSRKFSTDYIVMIEEPEATLHSSALQALVSQIVKINNPRLRFLLTSHSFRLLAALHTSIKMNPSITGGSYRIYILSKGKDLTTQISEYSITDAGELIASSMEPLSLDELRTIHAILSLGGPIE